MSLILPLATAFVLLGVPALMAVFCQLGGRRRCAVDLEWCRDFSAAKYRPMERLLVEPDDSFLSAQPTLNPVILRRLRAERRRIFRRYLGELSRDFDQLLAAAKMLVVNAAEDRPDLAKALIRRKLAFSYTLAVVRCRLVLNALGIGSVDVRPLVRALGDIRMQLGTIAEYARVPVA